MLNVFFFSPIHTDGACVLMLLHTSERNSQIPGTASLSGNSHLEASHKAYLFLCRQKPQEVEGLNHVCMKYETFSNKNTLWSI